MIVTMFDNITVKSKLDIKTIKSGEIWYDERNGRIDFLKSLNCCFIDRCWGVQLHLHKLYFEGKLFERKLNMKNFSQFSNKGNTHLLNISFLSLMLQSWISKSYSQNANWICILNYSRMNVIWISFEYG